MIYRRYQNDIKKNKEDVMEIKEKTVKSLNGYTALVVVILALIISLAGAIYLFVISSSDNTIVDIPLFITALVLVVIHCLLYILFAGFKALKPNDAYVFTLFGKYYGTLKESGFYFVNPFVSAMDGTSGQNSNGISVPKSADEILKTAKLKPRTISTKIQTLVNDTQKVNDKLGNPIVIGAIVVWKVSNPTMAVFNVNNYSQFLSSQADSIIRNVARLYPYDDIDENSNDELTLRGSSVEIASRMKIELQESVQDAGLEIIEVRINQLSYSSEIAAAMLQRQQAVAIIAARQKIVEGAVSMVQMALDSLSEKEIVNLDEERKAQMVSNLLVILCGNKDAQPIINSGTIY